VAVTGHHEASATAASKRAAETAAAAALLARLIDPKKGADGSKDALR
jgi:hypothetical protein